MSNNRSSSKSLDKNSNDVSNISNEESPKLKSDLPLKINEKNYINQQNNDKKPDSLLKGFSFLTLGVIAVVAGLGIGLTAMGAGLLIPGLIGLTSASIGISTINKGISNIVEAKKQDSQQNLSSSKSLDKNSNDVSNISNEKSPEIVEIEKQDSQQNLSSSKSLDKNSNDVSNISNEKLTELESNSIIKESNNILNTHDKLKLQLIPSQDNTIDITNQQNNDKKPNSLLKGFSFVILGVIAVAAGLIIGLPLMGAGLLIPGLIGLTSASIGISIITKGINNITEAEAKKQDYENSINQSKQDKSIELSSIKNKASTIEQESQNRISYNTKILDSTTLGAKELNNLTPTSSKESFFELDSTTLGAKELNNLTTTSSKESFLKRIIKYKSKAQTINRSRSNSI